MGRGKWIPHPLGYIPHALPFHPHPLPYYGYFSRYLVQDKIKEEEQGGLVNSWPRW